MSKNHSVQQQQSADIILCTSTISNTKNSRVLNKMLKAYGLNKY